MKFEMNNRIYTIKTVSQNELWGDIGSERTNNQHYFGRFFPMQQELWLCEDLKPEQIRITLIHELIHCYMYSYNTYLEECNEEDICNIAMNSHDIIHKIVENYFK